MSGTAPQQKPGKSRQDYQTPPEFLRAVERDFSVTEWAMDLAATHENAVTPVVCGYARRYLGPGSTRENALEVDWSLLGDGDFWLNPPFADIDPWVAKCATTVRVGRIFCLVPASVGSNWYAAHVHGISHVVAVSPRVTFVGCDGPYPKDLVLAIYGTVRGGFSTWRWK